MEVVLERLHMVGLQRRGDGGGDGLAQEDRGHPTVKVARLEVISAKDNKIEVVDLSRTNKDRLRNSAGRNGGDGQLLEHPKKDKMTSKSWLGGGAVPRRTG